MKKIICIALSLALLLTSAPLLSSCKAGSIVGDYSVSSISEMASETTKEAIDSYINALPDEDYYNDPRAIFMSLLSNMKINFEEDGYGEMTFIITDVVNRLAQETASASNEFLTAIGDELEIAEGISLNGTTISLAFNYVTSEKNNVSTIVLNPISGESVGGGIVTIINAMISAAVLVADSFQFTEGTDTESFGDLNNYVSTTETLDGTFKKGKINLYLPIEFNYLDFSMNFNYYVKLKR